MERKDVMSKNVSIYKSQASALEKNAAPGVKVMPGARCQLLERWVKTKILWPAVQPTQYPYIPTITTAVLIVICSIIFNQSIVVVIMISVCISYNYIWNIKFSVFVVIF